MTVEALRRGRPDVLADLVETCGREIQAVAYLIPRDATIRSRDVAGACLRGPAGRRRQVRRHSMSSTGALRAAVRSRSSAVANGRSSRAARAT